MKTIIRAFVALAAVYLASPAFGQQQYDPGGKAKVSLYCKTTTNGDTACLASPTVTATNPSVSATGSSAPASATQIGCVDGSGNLRAPSSSNPCPTSDATAQADLGPPGATACATDTGSCSLNALLQRIAQRLTTLGSSPATAGTVYSGNVTTTAVAANASATKLRSYAILNNNSAICYLQVWNTAQGSVTVGTTAPLFSIGIPALGGANMPLNFNFTTALTVAATTTRTGSSACTNGMDINLFQD